MVRGHIIPSMNKPSRRDGSFLNCSISREHRDDLDKLKRATGMPIRDLVERCIDLVWASKDWNWIQQVLPPDTPRANLHTKISKRHRKDLTRLKKKTTIAFTRIIEGGITLLAKDPDVKALAASRRKLIR